MKQFISLHYRIHIWIALCLLLTVGAGASFIINRPVTHQVTELPDTSVINPGMLFDARERIRSGSALPAQVDTLRARADAAMAAPVQSVMEKDIVPPSGDMHDYISRAPYFWPNPDTPDGLPYIKKDGEVYEPNRSGTDFYARNNTIQNIITLAISYYLLEEDQYAENAATRLRTWFLDPETRMNPNLNFAQGVPGIWDGSLWGIIETYNFTDLIDAITLIQGSEAWTAEDAQAMADWFDDYKTWLQTSELGFDESLMWNNHGSFYDAQVAALSIYAGKPEIARDVLLESRNRRINHGIEADGRQRYELERTRSFGYSTFNLRAFFYLASIGDKVDVDIWNYEAPDGSGIRAALDFLAHYSSPENEWPYKDIKYDVTVIIPLLRWASYVYNDPSYAEAARQVPGYSDFINSFPRRSNDIPQMFLKE